MQDSQLLPKWLAGRYAVLLKVIDGEPFDFDKACKVLHKAFPKDDERIIRLMLSQLRKAGWISVEFDKEDNRMRVYKLNDLRNVYTRIADDILANSKPKR
jgi:hypothetical protein